jgi:thiamine transporter
MGWSKGFGTRVLAEIAVLVALSAVLFYFKVYTFPQGGEITFGSMTPILLLALRRGVRAGVVGGVIFSFIVLALEPFVYYPVQYLLDYPLAFGALGLAGIFRNRGGVGALAGVALGISGRFLCHFLSGIVFFASYAQEAGYNNAAVYSVVYNASYLIPEFAISATAILGLARAGLVKVKNG